MNLQVVGETRGCNGRTEGPPHLLCTLGAVMLVCSLLYQGAKRVCSVSLPPARSPPALTQRTQVLLI